MPRTSQFPNSPFASSIEEARALIQQCAEPRKVGELVKEASFAHHDVWRCPFLEREIFGMATRGGSMPTKWTSSGA
jgi:hypothetical protein